MDWTDDKINHLKKLWSEGMTTTAIGAALKISKNAVAGKVHRLNLKRRPSPMTPARKATVKKAARPTLGIADLSARSCRWPSGDPQQPDFHFCGAAVLEGRPYCATHCGAAYVGFGNGG